MRGMTRKEAGSIVGHTRTIHTAVLVVEYLRDSLAGMLRVDRGRFRYRVYDTPKDGWVAEIRVVGRLGLRESHEIVETCRAFVAGRGEIWV